MSKLKELLADQLSKDKLVNAPSSFDIIGHIAVIKIPDKLWSERKVIGEQLHRIHKNVRTVLAVSGPTKGDYRLRKYEVIWGVNQTETIYREHGCIFKLDLEKVFFNSRLSFERERISKLIKPGETVVNMFAGVGTFSIIITKKQSLLRAVYSIDINPFAYRYMKENIRLNKVGGKVVPILGDVREVVNELLSGSGDRVLMPLPSLAIDYLWDAIKCLKENKFGIIHFYHECSAKTRSEALEKAKMSLKRELNGKMNYCFLTERIVRPVAPYKYHVAVDLQITR